MRTSPFCFRQSSGTMPSASASKARRGVADAPAGDCSVRRDLGQRHQHEGAVEKFGMGKGQPVGRHGGVTIGDDVDVDDPRTPAFGGNTAEIDLEPLDPVEQRFGSEAGQRLRAGVDERLLVGLSPRRRAIQFRGGDEFDPRLFPERADRPAQRCGPVADVAAERKKNAGPGLGRVWRAGRNGAARINHAASAEKSAPRSGRPCRTTADRISRWASGRCRPPVRTRRAGCPCSIRA